jgi:predicted oxidoreductase
VAGSNNDRFTDNADRHVRLREVLTEIGETLNATLDQIALAWLLKHPAKVVPILGTGKLAWIRNEI